MLKFTLALNVGEGSSLPTWGDLIAQLRREADEWESAGTEPEVTIDMEGAGDAGDLGDLGTWTIAKTETSNESPDAMDQGEHILDMQSSSGLVLLCTCGETIRGATEEEATAAWLRHTGEAQA